MHPARPLALLLVATLALPQAASALCMASGEGCGEDAGARFLKPPIVSEPRWKIGDRVPDDAQVLMNTRRYGLPPAQDGWVYMKVENRLYRVDFNTRTIVDDATLEANRAF